MYLGALRQIPKEKRADILEQIEAAQWRLLQAPAQCHPALGRYAELAASAHLETGNSDEAAEYFKKAIAYYAQSHRGPPKNVHMASCLAKLKALRAKSS